MHLIQLLFFIMAMPSDPAHGARISDCDWLLRLPQDTEVHVRVVETADRFGSKLRRQLKKDFDTLKATPGIRGIDIQSRYGKRNRSDESVFYQTTLTFSGLPAIIAAVLPTLSSSSEVETLPFRSEQEIRKIDEVGGVKNIDPEDKYLQ